jgi:ketosteroid isomerase-like protein
MTTLPEHRAALETDLKGALPHMSETRLPLQLSFVRSFAQDWIEAWNSHDLERILAHYDDEVTLTSPVALKLVGDSSVRGKAALRNYFSRGLRAYPDLRFDPIDVLWGIDTIVLTYSNNVRGAKTAEVLLLNSGGKVIRVWANYDQ